MLTHRPPFKSNNMKELYKRVITASYPNPKSLTGNGFYSQSLFDLIKMIL